MSERQVGRYGPLAASISRVLIVCLVAGLVSVVVPQVQARAATVVNVKDYGATGNGTTDDSVAIRLAMTAGSTPRTVVFPPGTYVFCDVAVDGGTHIVFQDGARAVSPLNVSPESSFFSVLGTAGSYASDVSLTGGEFEGRPFVRGVFVAKYTQNVRVSDVSSRYASKNVGTDMCRDVVVERCSARDGLIGFAFQKTERVTITDSVVEGVDRDGILFYNQSRWCVADGNTVSDYHRVTGTGVGGIQVYGSTDATITNNIVTDGHNDSAGIRFRDAERFWCEGNYVSDPGTSAYQVHRVGDFAPLQGGDGTFLRNVAVRPKLRGFDVQNALCKPVRVIGNTITDTTSSSSVSAGTGIMVVPAGSVIVGNTIERASGPGLEIGGSRQLVAWNTVRDVARVNFGPRVGVFVSGSDHALVENDVRDTQRSMLNGIRLYTGGSALVRGNSLLGATGEPYDLRGSRLAMSRGDATPPEVRWSVSGPGSLDLTLFGTDAGSGVVAFQVSIDNGVPAMHPGPNATVHLPSTGAAVLYAAIDGAGNVTRGSLIADAILPTMRNVTGPSGTLAAGAAVGFQGTLVTGSGAPIPGREVVLERWNLWMGSWASEAGMSTGADGTWRFDMTAERSELYRVRSVQTLEENGCSTAILPVTVQRPAVTAVPLAGADRITTAIEISKKAYPSGSADYVVITTAANWPDALGGSALAGSLDAPVLLTPGNALPTAVAAEIMRIGAGKAIILGGTGAVSGSVEAALRSQLGSANVERLGGRNRYETARLTASRTIEAIVSSGADYDGVALIATGANFPDALGGSPLAAANGWPIFLTSQSGADAQTIALMKSIGVRSAIVLGGTGAVSDSAKAAIASGVGCQTQRVAGSNRYSTAAAIASFGVFDAGMDWNAVAIATGADFPDALAGGVLQGENRSVILLTPSRSLDPGAEAELRLWKQYIREVRFLGGAGAVSTATRNAALAALK